MLVAFVTTPIVVGAQQINLAELSQDVQTLTNVVTTLTAVESARRATLANVATILSATTNELASASTMSLSTPQERAVVSAKLTEIATRLNTLVPVVSSLAAVRLQEIQILGIIQTKLVSIQSQLIQK